MMHTLHYQNQAINHCSIDLIIATNRHDHKEAYFKVYFRLVQHLISMLYLVLSRKYQISKGEEFGAF
jgi:hypothetical protein